MYAENEEKYREAYLELRWGTRSLLGGLDVPSNPGWSNGSIVSELRKESGLSPIKEYEEWSEDHFMLFRNSLVQIVSELGGQIPETDDPNDPLAAKRIIWILHGLLLNGESWEARSVIPAKR